MQSRESFTPRRHRPRRLRGIPACAAAGVLAIAVAGATRCDAASNAVQAAAPAWVTSIEPGTWAPISRNVLADVDPARDSAANPGFPDAPPWRGSTGQKGVINAWNGGAFASRLGRFGSLVLFGGGHNDYFGNEIYAFDLETLEWRRLTNPYAAPRSTLTAFYREAEFPDGSPLPPHTYDYIDYDPASNSLVLLKGLQQLGVSGGVESGTPAHLFQFDERSWRRSSPAPEAYGSSGWSAYDSRREVFWINPPGYLPRPGFRYFAPTVRNRDGSVGAWSRSYGARRPGGGDGMASYDPVHDILVYTDFRTTPGVVYGVNLASPSDPAVPLVLAGNPPELGTGHGWEWSDLRRSFIFWPRTAGAAVHELRLQGSDWRRGPWTWSAITSPDNATTPAPMTADHGVFGRFRVVRFADAEVAVVVCRIDGPVYAFRIPDPN